MSFAGLAEILFIAILALIVIGPKDLPKVLFMLGRFVHSIKSMSSEFMKEFEAIHHFTETEEMGQKNKEKSAHQNTQETHGKTPS